MKTKLYEVCETVSTNNLRCATYEGWGENPFNSMRAVLDMFMTSAKYAMCFDSGNIDDWRDYVGRNEQYPFSMLMPYEQAWFDIKLEKVSVGVMLKVCGDGTLDAILFSKNSNNEWLLVGYMNIKGIIKDDLIEAKYCPDETNKYGSTFLWHVYGFLRALNSKPENIIDGVCKVKKSQRRALDNKVRKTIEVKTLKVEIPKKQHNREDARGERNSPRVHARRGHIRRCKSGKIVYIKPQIVGEKRRGYVHKNYEAKRAT